MHHVSASIFFTLIQHCEAIFYKSALFHELGARPMTYVRQIVLNISKCNFLKYRNLIISTGKSSFTNIRSRLNNIGRTEFP